LQPLNIDQKLKTVNKDRGRLIVKQELGQLRTLASQLRAFNNDLDEEYIFTLMCTSWIDGVKSEITNILKPELSTKLLDIWHRKND